MSLNLYSTKQNFDVSVVMPCYNAAATVARAIESVLSQMLSSFELILVDDGSVDNTLNILKDFEFRDSRVSVYSVAHQGVVGANNFGFSKSSGSLIARMDADDIMHPRRLELQKAEFDKDFELGLLGTQVRAGSAVTYSGIINNISNGLERYIDWQNSCLTHDQITNGLYNELTVANPTIMIRKSVWENSGGYKEGDFPEDYEFLFRLSAQGIKMRKIASVLHTWTDSESRLTRTDPRYSRQAFDNVRYEYLKRDPRINTDIFNLNYKYDKIINANCNSSLSNGETVCNRNTKENLIFWGAGADTRKRSKRLLEAGIKPCCYIDVDTKKTGREFDGIPVYPPDYLTGKSKESFVLEFVRNHGAKDKIREYLENLGYREGIDYLSVG